MKFPKNRANLYIVVRLFDKTTIAGFSEYDEAVDFAGACEQEWLEKVGEFRPFTVQLITYYG